MCYPAFTIPASFAVTHRNPSLLHPCVPFFLRCFFDCHCDWRFLPHLLPFCVLYRTTPFRLLLKTPSEMYHIPATKDSLAGSSIEDDSLVYIDAIVPTEAPKTMKSVEDMASAKEEAEVWELGHSMYVLQCPIMA